MPSKFLTFKTLPVLLGALFGVPALHVSAEEVQVPKPALPSDTPKPTNPTAPTNPSTPAPANTTTTKSSGNAAELLKEGREAYKNKEYGQSGIKLKAAADAAAGNDTGIEGQARLYLGMTLIQQGKYQEGADQVQKAKDLKLSAKENAEADAALTYCNLYGGVTSAKRTPTATAAASNASTKKWFLNLTAAQDFTTDLAVPNSFNGVTLDPVTLTYSNGDFNVRRDDDFRSWAYLNGGYRFDLSTKDKLTLEDSFYQSIYADFDAYNLQLHQPKVTYQHTVNNKLFFKTSYDFQYLLLGGGLDPYEWSHRGAADVFLGSGNKFWFQGHYDVQQSTFRDRNQDQDNITHTVGGNMFFLMPNWRKYFELSYQHQESTAHSDRWSNSADKVALSGLYYFTKKDSWYAQASYEAIRYDGKDVIHQDRSRYDKMATFMARYTHDFTKKISLWAQYKLQDDNSNIRREDYTSHTATIGASFKF